MNVDLFPFQKTACDSLRLSAMTALYEYQRTHAPQIISFTAPTGAGKTIIIAALIENILAGDNICPDQPEAIFVWLSDSPQLNEQSKQKIDLRSDKITLDQCISIQDDSFDQELLDDGHIYFLNTQKLGRNSNLVSNGDNRTYSIWETLANTVQEKGDRLYFIIDEAHRGMHDNEAAKATTIMQKFIKGSEENGIPPMPVVIGMSATMERFDKLVEGTTSTIRKCVITSDDVRSSGLLKDRIIITYHPEKSTAGQEMAVLQAAADDWKQKWDHWTQYCKEQHYAYVNPILVVQVLNGEGDKNTETDLDDCLHNIEDRTGFHFTEGEVVHSFGQPKSTIQVNGLNVRYEEASRISDDLDIKVVFFKENLSTGWDCPRAETMMSFRRATDATHIAQLLGRMVRTPMQMHIQVDEVLNDVHLFLPHFDKDTVTQIVDKLQSSEGGNIPTDIVGEPQGVNAYDTLTIYPNPRRTGRQIPNSPGQMQLGESSAASGGESEDAGTSTQQGTPATVQPRQPQNGAVAEANTGNTSEQESKQTDTPAVPPEFGDTDDAESASGSIDREAVVKFINDAGLLSYNVRTIRINDYLKSLYKLAHLLCEWKLYPTAVDDVNEDVVKMIKDYVDKLKSAGKYDELASQVSHFELETQIFDIFGESVDENVIHDMFASTDDDIYRQYALADKKLEDEGIGNAYGGHYFDQDNPNAFRIDVILFAANSKCMKELQDYAEDKFHELNDEYRRKIASFNSDRLNHEYEKIVSDGDAVSTRNFRLPETIKVPHDDGGKLYSDHLFVEEETGTAKVKLNTWETGTLEEERQRDDFVCWIRNPSRGAWSLCIPYELDGEMKAAYPDFIVVRRDEPSGYIIDVLEPHWPNAEDNLGKAKGFAEYARKNPGLGRIQLIRKTKDVAGQEHFVRLDMSQSAVRDKVAKLINKEELDHLFDTDGFYDD